jgi:hypothetical protein
VVINFEPHVKIGVFTQSGPVPVIPQEFVPPSNNRGIYGKVVYSFYMGMYSELCKER